MRLLIAGLGLALFVLGCEDPAKKSAEASKGHVAVLVEAAKKDHSEVQTGLPLGAKELSGVFHSAYPELPDFQTASTALERVRNKVPELMVAKSTFFALVAPDGKIVRRDGEQDPMAGKNLFEFFPKLKDSLDKGYVESRGSMPEAAGVRGRTDAQWVAAAPISDAGQVRGLYVTGWSWSAYAYRLETNIRSSILGQTKPGEKVPLIYVYVVVGADVFGAPISPTVSADAIKKLGVLGKLTPGASWATTLEITGRAFGLSAARVPELGDDVAIAVLRSET